MAKRQIFKEILLYIASGMMILGCGIGIFSVATKNRVKNVQQEEVKLEISPGLTDDWTDMKVLIDGVLYELPIAYSELEKNGWYYDWESWEKGEIWLWADEEPTQQFDLSHEVYGSDCVQAGLLTVVLDNPSDQHIVARDGVAVSIMCDIVWVDGDYGYDKPKYPEFELCGGIKFGSSEEEVILAYGECEKQNMFVSEDGYVKYFTYKAGKKRLQLGILQDKGVVSILIQNFEENNG